MLFATLLLVHTALGEGESLWANTQVATGPWSTNRYSWAQPSNAGGCIPAGGSCQFTEECCVSPRRACLNGQSADDCELDQPAVVCQDNVMGGSDKHGNQQYYGSANTRKCATKYNYGPETFCSNEHNYYDSGDRRTAVQRTVPVYCSIPEEREPQWVEWPRPEFDCKTNQGVRSSDIIGNRMSMNYEQCRGYFMHAEWSFTWDKNSNGCWRVKENAVRSGRGGQTTCKLTRSANPVVGSAEDKARQAEVANGDYVKGTIGTDECPSGSVVVDDEDRCKAAAKKFGMQYNMLGMWETSPKGCIFDKQRGVFFNAEYSSSKHSSQARICERGGRAPVSWWADEEPDTDHECAEDCRAWWRGDGRCDQGCNVASCNWDDGDCGAASETAVGSCTSRCKSKLSGQYLDKDRTWKENACLYQCGYTNIKPSGYQSETAVGSCTSRCKSKLSGQYLDKDRTWKENACLYQCGYTNIKPSGYQSAESVAMHAAPTSEVPLPVTVFAAVGFVATLYGAFKHFTK